MPPNLGFDTEPNGVHGRTFPYSICVRKLLDLTCAIYMYISARFQSFKHLVLFFR